MNALIRCGWLALVMCCTSVALANEAPCQTCQRPVCYQRTCVADNSQPSWIFRRSTYTHDPETGARVAQYMRTPPVEPLADERNYTSRYRRIRTNLRGTDGSQDSTYEVQGWGNGRGGLDAEWERFHDAWKESSMQGGYYNGPANNFPGGWNGQGNWNGGWNGQGNWGGGGWNGGGWNGGGGGWNQSGPGPNNGGPNNGPNGGGH